jgi:predicted metalloprotease
LIGERKPSGRVVTTGPLGRVVVVVVVVVLVVVVDVVLVVLVLVEVVVVVVGAAPPEQDATTTHSPRSPRVHRIGGRLVLAVYGLG